MAARGPFELLCRQFFMLKLETLDGEAGVVTTGFLAAISTNQPEKVMPIITKTPTLGWSYIYYLTIRSCMDVSIEIME
jgi:hypothetical protein